MTTPVGAGPARLFVTGVGLVTPLGVGVEATWSRLVRGDRAIGPIRGFDASQQRVGIAGEVAGVVVEGPSWSRTSAMAATAAAEALQTAGLDPRGMRVGRVGRIGLVVGGTTGGMVENEQLLARLHAEPRCRDTLAAMLSHPLTSTADRIDERLGPFARARTLSSACSSGANAILVAASWLLAGDVDAVLAGGSDGLCRLTLSGFNALGAIDPEPCRPFDRRRRGTSLGEGAGFMVLERESSARARGATLLAELAGWAAGSEAHHITNPAPDGAVVAALVEQAIARAGLTAREVDYVSAHGTGTLQNDAMEAAALARAFGEEIERIPVSSSKAQIGHTLGAAGAIEAVFTALVVKRRTLVPTAGLDEPDPAVRLVHVAGAGREVSRVRAAVSNAFGFGGMDTVLVFAEPAQAAQAGRGTPRKYDAAPGAVVVTGAAVAGACGLAGVDLCATMPDAPADPRAALDPDAHLDAARARRLDATAKLGVVTVERAIAEAGCGDGDGDGKTGLVLGSAFGNVDGSAAFMHRIFEKGPRSASPADFPNLVPSSMVGHASIYLGLHGPAFATADLATSGESAFVQGVQLLGAGEVGRVVVGAVEPKSSIVERVLAALFAPVTQAPAEVDTQRRDVAAAVVLETRDEARRRGARVLAVVMQTLEWRADAAGAVAGLVPPPAAGGEVVLPHRSALVDALVARTTWGGCPRVVAAPSLRESEALGAVAVAVAASRIAAGMIAAALVVGIAQGRGYFIVLSAP